MEKIQENMYTSVFLCFVQENYIKAHFPVFSPFNAHFTPPPRYIIMVKGPLECLQLLLAPHNHVQISVQPGNPSTDYTHLDVAVPQRDLKAGDSLSSGWGLPWLVTVAERLRKF